jgi:hypothetical protein
MAPPPNPVQKSSKPLKASNFFPTNRKTVHWEDKYPRSHHPFRAGPETRMLAVDIVAFKQIRAGAGRSSTKTRAQPVVNKSGKP